LGSGYSPVAFDGQAEPLELAIDIASYGQTRKLCESLWFWIAANVRYIPLYGYKGLWVTAVGYGVFLALCVRGLFSWRREDLVADTLTRLGFVWSARSTTISSTTTTPPCGRRTALSSAKR
jgi:hypothetical protein